MTEFKSTKIALINCVISLILSCAMLFGTTYAWFADTISSSDNRILTGNLDIDLLMYKTSQGDYVSIADGSGDIFAESNGGEGIVWEPDKTEIAYLAVKNMGSLALKYDIRLNTEGGLAGALEYAILGDVKAEDAASISWFELTGNSDTQTGNLEEGLIPVVRNGILTPRDETYYLAVAVHMPDNAPNGFQGDSITVDLTLVATQTSYEEDSFGKGYDAGAEYEEFSEDEAVGAVVVTVNTIEDFAQFTEAVNTSGEYEGVRVANNPDVYVQLETDIDLSEYADFVGIGDGDQNSFDGTFDGNGYKITNYTADNVDSKLALFRTTNDADIINLMVEGFNLGTVTDTGSEYGVLIGAVCGGDIVIDNVTVKNSTITGQRIIGALVGTMTEGHLTITDCVVENVTIKNADGYTDVVGVLLGDGYSENDYDESGFEESGNTITNVKWFSAGAEQSNVSDYNYIK